MLARLLFRLQIQGAVLEMNDLAAYPLSDRRFDPVEYGEARLSCLLQMPGG